jgi:putative hydrolase of the HAD superfamily
VRANGLHAVLFDAGNTLIYIDPRRMLEVFAAEGVAVDEPTFVRAELEARRALHDGIARGAAGTEPELWGRYFATLFTASGVPDDALAAVTERVRDEHHRSHLWTHAAQDTRGVLGSLLAEGYRLAVISNADGRVEDLLVRTGLRDRFEFVIDSALVGMEKPDPAIFREACARLELPPDACIYVGDLYPVDYEGATSAGLRGVLIDPLGLYEGKAPRVASLAELPGFLAGAPPFP